MSWEVQQRILSDKFDLSLRVSYLLLICWHSFTTLVGVQLVATQHGKQWEKNKKAQREEVKEHLSEL